MKVTEQKGKKMNNMFLWIGGFLTGFGIGLAGGIYGHHYEVCDRKYDNFNDVTECVWIMENQ